MTIISVKKLPMTRNFAINEKSQQAFTATWIVLTDDKNESPEVIAASIDVAPLDYLITYPTGYVGYKHQCTGVSADCIAEDGLSWRVTATWGYLEDEGDPLKLPPEIDWGFAQFQRNTDRAIDGTAILNSAYDPFSDPVEIDDSRPVLSVVRNELHFNSSLAYLYRDAINSDVFQGAGPGQVKVSNISSTRQRHPNPVIKFYWRTSYEFHFNPNGWDRFILDQGYREYKAGKKQNITVQGVVVQEPALLNGAGIQLNPTDTPKFRKFKVYPQLPFSIFNLDEV